MLGTGGTCEVVSDEPHHTQRHPSATHPIWLGSWGRVSEVSLITVRRVLMNKCWVPGRRKNFRWIWWTRRCLFGCCVARLRGPYHPLPIAEWGIAFPYWQANLKPLETKFHECRRVWRGTPIVRIRNREDSPGVGYPRGRTH